MKITIYRSFYAALAWTVIIGQFIVFLQDAQSGGLGGATITYLGYFTIQTNILAALVMTASVLNPGGWASKPNIRGAIVVYIIIVAVVYHGVLAKLFDLSGIDWWLNHGLHTILPIMYVIDWVLFSQKSGLRLRHAVLWLIFPVFFCAYSLIRGYAISEYVYPFLDPTVSSWTGVSINVMVLVLMFFIGGLMVVYLNKSRKI